MQINSHFYYKSKNLRIKSLRDNNMSHHSMNTFFSGTDTNTLLEEGKDRNNFVSLIVNNQGTYSAAVTRRVKHEIIMQDTVSYKFFGQGEIKEEAEVTHEETEEVEYFYLNIEIEGLRENNQFLSKRLKEIQDRKRAVTKVGRVLQYSDENPIPYGTTSIGLGRVLNPSNVYKNPLNSSKPVQTTLWPEKSNKKDDTDDNFNKFISRHGISMQEDIMEENVIALTESSAIGRVNDDDDIPKALSLEEASFDEKVVNLIVKQLITCSLSIRENTNINLESWARKMPEIFKDVFETENNDFSRFEEWADMFCEFLITGTHDEQLELSGYELDEIEAILARDVMNELADLKRKTGKNKYIDIYIKKLGLYTDIIEYV